MSAPERAPLPPARFDVLGVQVSAIDMSIALTEIFGWVARREPRYVCVTGVHGVMESTRDDELRAIHNAAGLVTPDGMPLVWLGQWNGLAHVRRVYGPDLLLACCMQSVEAGYRHFFYGGTEAVVARLAARLTARFPGLRIAGTYAPPFRPLTAAEDADVARRIADAGADLVWVGLSTPKQERWMHDHVGRVGAPVLLGVGAAFDFVSGTKPQAPRWMQRSGLEWCYRLAAEPRRLWRRYLVNNPLFVGQVLARAVSDNVGRRRAAHE
jgi:N-acetylglucosaminyldiphosphoundecaprenol N-acetyl-beta-D-mannosaminyltransferase